MFKSFFPKPGTFFLSAFVWALIAVIFWQAGGGDWVARITGASGQIPISAARFWSLDFLIFYAYYIVCVGLFALFWFIYSPHRWQYWSILGTALIIFVTWFLVEVGVAVNAWYAPFYDLIQTARHCCKVSDEAAFCLIQRPYVSKTLLTRRISPRGSP